MRANADHHTALQIIERDAEQHVDDKPDPIDWTCDLLLNEHAKPRAILANAITALRKAPGCAGVLAFNEFSESIVAISAMPWGAAAGTVITDRELLLFADWLQRTGIHVTAEVARQAVLVVARDKSFHPVRTYLDGLAWDGKPRLEKWLSTYIGAEDNEYTSVVGKRFAISAVARIYRPGVKADCSLIFEGAQGTGKSSALRTLAGEEFFSDEIADLGSKDAAMQTRGVWVIELAELDSLSRAEVSKIKAFISRARDRFRPPYGRLVIESPRQCVFAGSVNHATYLRDETGGRRFWPVKTGVIKLDDLARDRDQLWAEAVSAYRSGERWWLDSLHLNEIAQEQQAERYEADPWQEIVEPWLDYPKTGANAMGETFTSTTDSTTIADVLTHAIGKRKDQWTQADKNRVGRCLRVLGWERYRDREGKRLEWRFRPSEGNSK